MILVFYPESYVKPKTFDRQDKRRKINQLVNKVEALRSSYNFQLEALRDEYYPKINNAVTELEELVN